MQSRLQTSEQAIHWDTTCHWCCLHSTRSRVHEMVEHLSVHLPVPLIDSSRRICCWAPCGQEISINSCRCRRSAENAGSITLTANEQGWTEICFEISTALATISIHFQWKSSQNKIPQYKKYMTTVAQCTWRKPHTVEWMGSWQINEIMYTVTTQSAAFSQCTQNELWPRLYGTKESRYLRHVETETGKVPLSATRSLPNLNNSSVVYKRCNSWKSTRNSWVRMCNGVDDHKLT